MANELSASDIFKGDQPVERLIKHLEDIYPCLNPHPGASLDEIMYRAGQRSVVDYLVELIED